MSDKRGKLNPVWLKASVLGSLWASSEIILGSFLHNLRVPFSSILLTGIAIMVLVSINLRWKEKGLIWRAGIICAVMKSVSPSAVIFGPMIAIVAESLLLEIPVRLTRRTYAGFIVGGMLAMSWNLVQKILNMLIYYGFSMVSLYTSMVEYAGRQLGIATPDPWTPVLWLWLLYTLSGALAAVMGIMIGRKPAGLVQTGESTKADPNEGAKKQAGDSGFRYSFAMLGLTIAGMISVLFLLNTPFPVAGFATGILFLILWFRRYHGIFYKLLKPKFWILFLTITMLSGFLVTQLNSTGLTWKDGIFNGLEMNFRAAIMMIGFSALAKELSNPVIRRVFLQTWFRQLPLALEVAFATLPFALASLPPWKEIRKNPVLTIRRFIDHADHWLAGLMIKTDIKKRVVIIAGIPGSGKSTLALWLAGKMRSEGIRVGGIIAPAIFSTPAYVSAEAENKTGFSDCNDGQEHSARSGEGGSPAPSFKGNRKGYNLLNLGDGTVMPLAQTEPAPGMEHTGRFFFNPTAIAKGKEILLPAATRDLDVVFIDEIGPWEIAGNGWATSLQHQLNEGKSHLIICVRTAMIDTVITHWQVEEPLVITANQTSGDEVFQNISDFLNMPATKAR